MLPLVDAQDPSCRSPLGRVVRHTADQLWLELSSDQSSPHWSDLLDNLARAGDGHEDRSSDGEDLISLAASQVGAVLEMLADSVADSERCWVELSSVYGALEASRLQHGKTPFFEAWLAATREVLLGLGADGSDVDETEAGSMVRAQSEAVRPLVLEVYVATAIDDW